MWTWLFGVLSWLVGIGIPQVRGESSGLMNETGSTPSNWQRWECFPPGPGGLAAAIPDCNKALLKFPHNAAPGMMLTTEGFVTFYLSNLLNIKTRSNLRFFIGRFRQTGGSPHKYILPKTEVEGGCSVTVVIADSPRIQDETSSWTSIGLSASQLIQACQSPGQNNVGGWTIAGDMDFLKITIRSIFGSEDLNSNTSTIESGGAIGTS